ncbi:MAG: SDR family NAD(P)-dependent oxidoreductase [Spirochaetia bacterium]|nr:SDR family NAD(P)-dependent oxidoreductase [Spirochaetia bacterium]
MSQDLKHIMITGAAGAIGSEIARKLIDLNSYFLILICRTEESKKDLEERFSRYCGMKQIQIEAADLALKSNVKHLAEKVKLPIHVLINNAACTPREREVTADGLEMQFAANILNYFWMTLAFRPHLKNAEQSRIVNVASYWAGDLDLEDLQFSRRPYSNNTAYRQSKQANRMLSAYFSELFKGDNISVNACHPGEVPSKLSYNLGFSGSESASKGAETPVWLASDDAGYRTTGKWYEYKEECPCRFSKDHNAMERLYEICMEYSEGF